MWERKQKNPIRMEASAPKSKQQDGRNPIKSRWARWTEETPVRQEKRQEEAGEKYGGERWGAEKQNERRGEWRGNVWSVN